MILMGDRFKFKRSKVYTSHNRDPKIQKFYESSEWRKLSRQVKEEANWLCEWCAEDDYEVNASYTHHIVEVKDDWSKRLLRSNLVAVCSTCHERSHNRTGTDTPTYHERQEQRESQIKKTKAATTDEWLKFN